MAHIIGVKVSAIKPEINTAPAKVKANSVNNFPVIPVKKPIGAYTATSVIVIEITGPTNSRAPIIEALCGSMPSSICRCIFSKTIIASSTTIPIARTIASKVSRFMVKPIEYIKNSAPTNDSGTVTAGIRELRTEPKKRKITTTTITTASTNVVCTSSMALRTYAVAS